MKRFVPTASAIVLSSALTIPAALAGGVPVIDAANYEVAKQ
ncbi:conjugal transfer protein, partial [Mesorhizobium sp. M1A.F.Ca.IN.022.02.1.1]